MTSIFRRGVSYHRCRLPPKDHPILKRGPSPRGAEVRIIGGRWRSRRLRFPDIPQLRPSPDAVRETLFNWLQFDLPGSRCLDLFAGSGALGFEAASRGAASVTMVESDPRAARQLETNAQMLDAASVIDVKNTSVAQFLDAVREHFDIVFMDPPFSGDDLEATIRLLQDGRAVTPDSLVYIESRATKEQLPLPAAWHIIRQKDRGAVRSTLIQYKPSKNDL